MVLKHQPEQLTPKIVGEVKDIETPNANLKVSTLRDVWGVNDSSAGYILQVLKNRNILNSEYLAGKTVLDMGAGTGVLGLVLYGYGAERVDMVDNNPEAVVNIDYNVEINGFSRRKLRAIESNCFDALQTIRYDLIVGNFPGLPDTSGHAHPGNKAYLSNENGPTGRYVQDQGIILSRRFLKPNAALIFTTFSFQDTGYTDSMLNDYYGKHWTVLNTENGIEGIDAPLKANPGEYHSPYINKWIMQSINSNSFRVFQRDENGNMILQYTEPGMVSTLFYPTNMSGTLMLKVQNGSPDPHLYIINQYHQRIPFEGTIDDIEVPDFDPESPYMYKYRIIMASNKVEEA